MSRSIAAPLAFGLVGCAVLLGLGVWQLQRLEWKESVIAQIETRMSEAPGPIPVNPDPLEDQYRQVAVEGVIGTEELHVYTAAPSGGVGYRVIAPLALEDDREILLDRGFVPISEKDAERAGARVRIEGALLWPDDGAGGPPDLEKNIWIARDPAAMAEVLGTEPVLVVAARSDQADGPVPLPVTVNIPNRHLEYVVTWFGLALVWAGMTAYFIWRIKRRMD